MLYLLQLVQALRYEDFNEIKAGLEAASARPRSESHVSQDYHVDRDRSSSQNTIPHPLAETPESPTPPVTPRDQEQGKDVTEECNLATFLIERACCNYTLANYLYWYLLVESDEQDTISKDSRIIEMYKTVLKCFSQSLSKGGKDCVHYRSLLVRQHTLTNHILNIMRLVAKENGNRKKKIERLQALLGENDQQSVNFTSFDPLPLPLHPEVKVLGVVAEKASMFKSSLMPIKLTFKTTDHEEYVAICKNGDDLRQDQLILQIITLMDQNCLIMSIQGLLNEECQRLGTKFKPLARSKKRAEDSDSQEVKKYSHHANSDTSESEAESDDSMSDLYPREDFERLQEGGGEGATAAAAAESEEDDDDSDFEIENMDCGSHAPNESNPTPGSPSKRKKKSKKGGRRKFAKTQATQESQNGVTGKKTKKRQRTEKT
eukprot:XP_011666402.1 PREDICTED: phosphatidylinositol 3-kinase catalytic subunit type 3 [Strongylocentrotus purpuratus]